MTEISANSSDRPPATSMNAFNQGKVLTWPLRREGRANLATMKCEDVRFALAKWAGDVSQFYSIRIGIILAGGKGGGGSSPRYGDL